MRIQYKSFPQDDRLWRLDWVGPIKGDGYRRAPTVSVQFTPLLWEGKRWRSDIRALDHAATIVVSLSINLWPDLRIGTFWRRGLRESPDAGDIVDVTANISASRLKISRAYDRIEATQSLVPPFEHRLHVSMAATNVLRVQVEGPGDLREIDIPCSELFRVYYGQSSRLAYHLLTGSFIGDRYNRIYDPKSSWCDGSECFVQLGHRIRNADALVVARLAFDPIAHANAKRIVADMAATASGETYGVVCFPPFEATTAWRLRGEYLDRGTRLLTWEILRCTAPFPAPNLVLGRENRDTSSGTGARRLLTKPAVANTIEQITIEEGAPRAGVLPGEIDILGSPIFAASLVSQNEGASAGDISVRSNDSSTFTTEVSSRDGCGSPVDLNLKSDVRDDLLALDGFAARVRTIGGATLTGILRVARTRPRFFLEMPDGTTEDISLEQIRSIHIVRLSPQAMDIRSGDQ